MTIYHVPIVGYIIAAREISKAQAAYFACHAKGGSCWAEYNATWGPFDNCTTAFASTIVGCVALILIVATITRFCKREAK